MTAPVTEAPRRSGPTRDGAPRLDVGMLSYGLPAPGLKRGGIERVAHDLAQGLAARGHRVTVYSYDPAPPGAAYRVRPLRGARFALSWLGRRLTMGYLGNALALDPRLRRHDVLVAHGDSLLLPLTGRPVLRVVHGSALGEALTARTPWRVAHQLGVYVQELLSGVLQRGTVAVSENTRRHNPFVRRVIPNGADLRAFHPDAGAKTPQPSILFVGALGGRKRGLQLVEWFRDHVRPRFPDATLTLLSEPGPEVAGVTYRSGVPADELAAMYRSAWLYCSPSSYEGFGLPYVEAMASGTPVVATPNPGSREVLADGAYGVLAEDSTFPAEMVRLLGDDAARDELARRGLERAATYGLDAVIDRYEETLVSLCAR